MPDLPTFIIIGAQKSGTTALARQLGRHPDVYTAPGEVHFFDRHFDHGLDWYREQFEAGAGCTAAGETTPAYMYEPGCAARIGRLLPGIRLVAILRHPVDRAYSHYWHVRTRGHEALEFAEAIEREPERIAAGGRDRDRFSYLDRGRYLEQLERTAAHVPRSDIAVVLHDDLRGDLGGTLAGLHHFIGVPADATNVQKRVANQYVTFRSARLRAPIRRLPTPLQRVATRLNSKPGSYPPMDPVLRRDLVERFAVPNAALAAWLGRDLSTWGS